MSTLAARARARAVSFDADSFWVEFVDGRKLAVPLAYFPRLLHATEDQRRTFEISGGGTGLHWDALDEDIDVEGLLLGVWDRTTGTSPRAEKAA